MSQYLPHRVAQILEDSDSGFEELIDYLHSYKTESNRFHNSAHQTKVMFLEGRAIFLIPFCME